MHETGRVRFAAKEGTGTAWVSLQSDLKSLQHKLVSLEVRTRNLEEAEKVAAFLNEHVDEFAIQDIPG